MLFNGSSYTDKSSVKTFAQQCSPLPSSFSSDLVNKLIKWSSTSFVKANVPLCKHVCKICFPALVGCLLESSSTQKGFERLIWFLAPFFFFCSLCSSLLSSSSSLFFPLSPQEWRGGFWVGGGRWLALKRVNFTIIYYCSFTRQ